MSRPVKVSGGVVNVATGIKKPPCGGLYLSGMMVAAVKF